MAAMNQKSDTYKTVISPLEFIRKLPVIIWRAPGLLYNLLKGLRMISGNAFISWGSILEDIESRFPDRTAIKSPDGEMTYRELNAGANQYARRPARTFFEVRGSSLLSSPAHTGGDGAASPKARKKPARLRSILMMRVEICVGPGCGTWPGTREAGSKQKARPPRRGKILRGGHC